MAFESISQRLRLRQPKSWRPTTACKAFAILAALAWWMSASPGHAENRSYDGTGNNLLNPTWGVAGTDFLRIAPACLWRRCLKPGRRWPARSAHH